MILSPSPLRSMRCSPPFINMSDGLGHKREHIRDGQTALRRNIQPTIRRRYDTLRLFGSIAFLPAKRYTHLYNNHLTKYLTPIDISSIPDLMRLAEEVKATNTLRVLKKADEAVAIPVTLFEVLVRNESSGGNVSSLVGNDSRCVLMAHERSTSHVVIQYSLGRGRHSRHPLATGLASRPSRNLYSHLAGSSGDCLIVQPLCGNAQPCVGSVSHSSQAREFVPEIAAEEQLIQGS